jgi:hypothetical protein
METLNCVEVEEVTPEWLEGRTGLALMNELRCAVGLERIDNVHLSATLGQRSNRDVARIAGQSHMYVKPFILL